MASDKWWRPKWWRRQDHARGRYAPRLWSVWLVAPIWVVAAIAIALIIYLQLRAVAVPWPGPNGGPAPRDPLDVIKTTITAAGFLGAVLVGVYGYRKQRLVEGDAHRADAEQLAQRYTTAADQLGHEKAAVRLAGVYAMARLADDWVEQRQVCIDVLCAYLRMPYETDPASEKYREGEREVRLTIIRIIRDHLQDPDPKPKPNAPTTWCGCALDFTNATFDGGDFTGAKFTGGVVLFDQAKFTTGLVSFNGAKFNGAMVSFFKASFTGGLISFEGAKFTAGIVSFFNGTFAGPGGVNFQAAEFSGADVRFLHAKFTSGPVSFSGAAFTASEVSFLGAEFAGSEISFRFARFTGGEIFFDSAEFIGGVISFDTAKYTGGGVSFDDAEFTGSRIAWGPFEPPAVWTELQERERRQNE
jgi:uncharacterized protein YjbI with pentapeptide repeats